MLSRRFAGYLASLACGLAAAHFITDGVNLSHFYSFVQTIFGTYVAGQSVTNAVAYINGRETN